MGMKRGILFAVLAFLPACGKIAVAQDDATVPFVEVIGNGLTFPVHDLQTAVQIGKPLRLYQELTNAYIVKVEQPDGSYALGAFPKYDKKGQATAWITKDKSVFFGMVVPSMPAGFTLEPGENLPVVGQTSRQWIVALRRHGDEITIRLAKNRPDIRYQKPVVTVKKGPSRQERLEEELRKYQSAEETPAEPEPPKESSGLRSFFGIGSKKDADKAGKSRRIVIAKGEGDELIAEIDGQKLGEMNSKLPEAKSSPEEPGPEEGPPVIQAAAEPEPIPEETPDGPAKEKTDVTKLIQRIAIAVLGAGLLIAVVVRIVQKKKANDFQIPDLKIKKSAAPKEKAKKKEPETPAKTDVQEELTDASVYFKKLANNKVDFSGSLSSFSLLDLIQFLNSTKETGDLQIRDDNGGEKAEIFFSKGEIIDAVFGKKTGVAAIFSLVKSTEGNFAFFRKKESEARRTIEMPTMSLMLEASKNMDEGPAAPPPKPAPKTKPLSLKKKK